MTIIVEFSLRENIFERNIMFDTSTDSATRTLIASLDDGSFDVESSLDELEELVRTAGGEVTARVTQKRNSPEAGTFFGAGKIAEMSEFVSANDIELVVIDAELSSSQIRNIADVVTARVIDRTMLILDIFAARAVTNEGKLQVELAQLRYRLPRLSGLGISMSRLGGGIGTRGPGESQLETDRRHIRRRIGALEQELDALTGRRQLSRARRKKDGRITAAVVGYTNAGKSTLMSKLTKSDVYAEDKLFATLDILSRKMHLPNGGDITLSDTVGLIRRLPHHLIEAFKSTLEEAASADIILLVCDVSDAEFEDKLRVSREILAELGCGGLPQITVYNKCDKLSSPPPEIGEDYIYISAKKSLGLDELKLKIEKIIVNSQLSIVNCNS